ncbi:hypothetical protein M422DRAFT_265182 [Sphaerobolus stellatus SS14]|uniref:Uncharacterized protein n=1 Tax=Sphaerobolus stellatus (strain SS14) TaxID=990650 RepID=A0A0C9TS13_SPHS4|nr:hypothetical protein M422DRAFT_265182 [Sphaerobolus stellatus SS14]
MIELTMMHRRFTRIRKTVVLDLLASFNDRQEHPIAPSCGALLEMDTSTTSSQHLHPYHGDYSLAAPKTLPPVPISSTQPYLQPIIQTSGCRHVDEFFTRSHSLEHTTPAPISVSRGYRSARVGSCIDLGMMTRKRACYGWWWIDAVLINGRDNRRKSTKALPSTSLSVNHLLKSRSRRTYKASTTPRMKLIPSFFRNPTASHTAHTVLLFSTSYPVTRNYDDGRSPSMLPYAPQLPLRVDDPSPTSLITIPESTVITRRVT